MNHDAFSPMEIDAIGEIMNISLGSSATAISNMLEHRVDITTPRVTVQSIKDFELGKMEPAFGVEIKYLAGLQGSNIMLLKKSDVKVIVDILMGTETADESFELDELAISAICEVMNQMMGAASTALSDFLGRIVNISTPNPILMDDMDAFKQQQFPAGETDVVVVQFSLKIENVLESEFINIMPFSLARDLVSGFELEPDAALAATAGDSSQNAPTGESKMSQDDIERVMNSMNSEPAASAATTPPPSDSTQQPPVQQPPIQQPPVQQPPVQQPPVQQPPVQQPPVQQMPPEGQTPPPYSPGYPYPYGYIPYPPEMYAPPDPKVIATQPLPMSQMDPLQNLSQEQSENLDLIMSVPLEITVEIGRTRRKVKDILSFSKGSLVVLDKLAGDQVDLFVNGKCIARGDVVVIDDNFGIRITEILQNVGLPNLT